MYCVSLSKENKIEKNRKKLAKHDTKENNIYLNIEILYIASKLFRVFKGYL